jgi:C-type lysozyme/alpha-lactalbumin family
MSLRIKGLVMTLFGIVAVSGCAADASPDADPGDDTAATEDALLAGRLYTAAEVADLVREAGFPEEVVGQMVCTAKFESSFFERATNKNKNGSVDRGLFQINSIHMHDPGCPSTAEGVFDAEANVKCARVIFRMQGLKAWFGYRKHKAECDRFVAP